MSIIILNFFRWNCQTKKTERRFLFVKAAVFAAQEDFALQMIDETGKVYYNK